MVLCVYVSMHDCIIINPKKISTTSNTVGTLYANIITGKQLNLGGCECMFLLFRLIYVSLVVGFRE